MSLGDIERRLAELETEKEKLLAQRDAVIARQRVQPDSELTREEKVSLFSSLFRGQENVYAYRWENKTGRSG